MALTLEQENALLALLDEKRTTLPQLAAVAEVNENDLLLLNQLLADKSVTVGTLKQFISPPASTAAEGIVRLSNELNSDSEAEAVTPKALKAVKIIAENPLVPVKSVNGKIGDVEITAQSLSAILEIDADRRYLNKVNAPKFTILYPGGDEASPGKISRNQRLVIDNPFPDSNSFAVVEVLYDGLWGDPGYVYAFGVENRSCGVRATATASSVTVVAGDQSVLHHATASGGPFSNKSFVTTPLPFRVKVWGDG